MPGNAAVNIGFFWGYTADSLSQLPEMPLGTMSAVPGIMTAPNGVSYQVNAPPNTVIFAQVRGWDSSFGADWRAAREFGSHWYGETDIRQLNPLGPSSLAPGISIWQTATGTDPNRFHPLRFNIPIPEPPTIALAMLGLSALLLLPRRHGR